MKTVQNNLFSLLRFAINGEELSENQKISLSQNLLATYTLAKFHDIAHLLANALDKNNLLLENQDLKNRLFYERNMAVYRYEQSKYELGEICRVLEDAKISHIPLKGSILREYYPEPWMRTSCDIDILVQEENLEKAITVLVEELGYKRKKGNAHDVSLYAPSGVHLELHFDLIEGHIAPESTIIYRDIWEYTRPCVGCQYRMEMTDGVFYFYHIGHMAKHFSNGGCGIRAFLDLWVLNQRISFDKEKRNDLLQIGGLLKFARCAEKLAETWFSNSPHTGFTSEMENYILQGGVYGTREQSITVKQIKTGGKLKYIWYRLFLPRGELCALYPKLLKRKWAYPYYVVLHWFRLIFKRGTIKNAVKDIKTNASVSGEKTKRTKKLFRDIGL